MLSDPRIEKEKEKLLWNNLYIVQDLIGMKNWNQGNPLSN